MPPMNEDTVRRRNLPHIDVDGKPYFITACLHDSIPAVGLSKIRRYREELAARPVPSGKTESQWKMTRQKLVFKMVDHLLDHESTVKHLSDDRLASVVQDSLLHFADERYHLFAFVVMPSHHHWLFLPIDEWADKQDSSIRTPRETISHSVQSFTGTQCNRILGRQGKFWQTETFDHFVRDEDEMFRIMNYIENNPVAAGLCKEPEQFRWSSARLRKELGIAPGDPIPNPKVA